MNRNTAGILPISLQENYRDSLEEFSNASKNFVLFGSKTIPLYEGSPISFLITESHKIIWSFHASQEIQNKISHS